MIGYMNYGNRLQNYATQEVIKSLGCHVETIVNYPRDENIKESTFEKIKRANLETYLKFPVRLIKKVRLKFYKTKKEVEIQELNRLKNNNGIEFTKENIKETDFTITPNSIPTKLDKNYDFFVVGSDQVWNPHFRGGSPIDFITFAPSEKRVAYSASFGVSEIPDTYAEKYKTWLREFAHISVREQSGANIVKRLADREVPVLIDPTMMLNKEKWLNISKPADEKLAGPYLLTYFLGQVSEDKSHWLKAMAQKNGLTIINLANIDDKEYYCADPGQFIYYINNCSILCTDSFHGVVFSILFEKPFVVFDRVSNTPSMSSRIDTILSKFQFESRKRENIKEADDVFVISYSHVPEILEAERNKAIDYLKNALDIKDPN